MQDIELIALKNYESNLEYLSHNHPKVLKKIQAFDILEEKQQIAKYELEYINGYFDVKNIKDNQYLYDTDSIKFSKKNYKYGQ
jgi:hypothetical protein